MCGIFGYIYSKNSKLDKKGFNILGVNNDSRGGDSCGIFIDGKVEYGVNKTKLYSNFFKESKLLKETNKCKIALGHCRKASVGNISLETAQPVVLYNDKKEVDFVVIHNGTIHNYKELAAKYIPNINITGMTDSQVMTRIFYYAGYDCLEEYYGGAVFVIVDYRDKEPKVLAFKGASKQYSASTTILEERPFYVIQNNNVCIFSSISTYLECIIPEESYYTIVANQLVEIKNDDIYLVKEYDRSNCWQSSNYPSNYEYSSNYKYYYEDFNTYNQGYLSFKEEKEEEKTHQKVMVTDGGIYTKGDKPLHGMYNIDNFGEVYNACFRNDINKLWFWDGVLLYGHSEFVFLKNLSTHYNLAPDDIKYCMPELLNYLSPYPISETDYVPSDFCINGVCKCFKALNEDATVAYNGSIQRFLTCKQIIYIDGKPDAVVYGKLRTEATTALKDLIKNNTIDISNLYKTLYQSCW